ncbi:uncharacterized protein SPSK_10654 [Sporothrix schenckii 1099-18]|uniref:Uncharacterized protein n=1 Tax=Sporothrix schenckii 1099-18 TaxID=1397361 RepID=A0A0F2LV27_SPOSC|nr:uncharacterized protein SPSK_10654 [Sporothrix schenckii 1099-18]KJR80694.1 hypothetical protein SPSK_10654 [Sporothrix schenckii 1099-18]
MRIATNTNLSYASSVVPVFAKVTLQDLDMDSRFDLAQRPDFAANSSLQAGAFALRLSTAGAHCHFVQNYRSHPPSITQHWDAVLRCTPKYDAMFSPASSSGWTRKWATVVRPTLVAQRPGSRNPRHVVLHSISGLRDVVRARASPCAAYFCRVQPIVSRTT